MIRSVVTLALAGFGIAAPSSSHAFWQRSQVSHCTDATTDAERARHRCEELRPYADPGWPALGVGDGAYRAYRYRSQGPAFQPGGRAPTRRLG